MKTILSITLLFVCQLCFAQKSDDLIAKEISTLASLKYTYEKNKDFAKYRPSKFAAKKEEAYAAYKKQIKIIKNNPEVLRYIERVIDNPELGKRIASPYYYFNSIHPFNPAYYYLSKLDYFRVIKYSLFDKDQDMLPEDLDGIPGLDRPKDVSPYPELQKDILTDPK